MESETVRKLLEEVAIAWKKRNANGVHFNVLRALRVDRLENECSDVLAYILDPSGDHGLGRMPLQTFCEQCLKDFPQVFDFSKACVKREYWITPRNRVDFYIADQNCKVVIEVKLYAREQNEQISRYWNSIGNCAQNAVYFLTLDGHAPETGVPTGCLSWNKDVKEWLKGLLGTDLVRGRMNVYNSLKNFVDLFEPKGFSDMEIRNLLLRDGDTLEAVMAIRSQLKQDIVNKKLNEVLKVLLVHWTEEKGIKEKVQKISTNASWAGLTSFSVNLNDGFMLSAQFQRDDFEDLWIGLQSGHVLSSSSAKNFKEKFPTDSRILDNQWWYTGDYWYQSPGAGVEWVKNILFSEKDLNYIEIKNIFDRIWDDYVTYAQSIKEALKQIGEKVPEAVKKEE